jgi:hypothetical protein
MIRRAIICIESRFKKKNGNTGTADCPFLIPIFSSMLVTYIFLVFNTVLLIQELASVPVPEMKRFLTSRSADEKADAADLLREKRIHPWRLTGDPTQIPRRNSFTRRLDHGRRLTLADVSAPGLQSTTSPGASNFNPPATSTLVPGGLPTPPFKVPLPVFQRTKNQSTGDAAAAWHARAAAAREARRPTYNKPSLPLPPSDELSALAERFRNAAANQQAMQIQQQLAQDLNQSTASSVSDSFYSVALQNTSIIDSDISEMGSLVDTAYTVNSHLVHGYKPPYACYL